ncbi:MAG: 1-acyl-sn-glycerol-3-phosphate acyltransferase [Phycisphaeraceae bacterium]|nr:1-acyl-sn-glycerol-3-phosphate acyltransferase [Phycisphaeraceae bacterium]
MILVVVSILVLGVLLGLGLLARWLKDNPRGDIETGLFVKLASLYARLVHGLRVEGMPHVPREKHPGSLIIIANHTAGVDPVLIQVVCPFEIRWIMAMDMRLPSFEWFWTWARIISIPRGNELPATREAIRHVREGDDGHGGVLGIFPEGAIERPERQILPFLRGVGLIIKKSEAIVLPVIIEGTPQVDPAWASLWRPSSSKLTFKQPLDYRGSGLSAEEISADLRRRFVEWTGWPANEIHAGLIPGKGY